MRCALIFEVQDSGGAAVDDVEADAAEGLEEALFEMHLKEGVWGLELGRGAVLRNEDHARQRDGDTRQRQRHGSRRTHAGSSTRRLEAEGEAYLCPELLPVSHEQAEPHSLARKHWGSDGE